MVCTLEAGQLTLTWNDNSANEDGFVIERAEGSGPFSQLAMTGVNVSSFVDNEVAESMVYSYRVKAFNEYGESGYTEVVSGSLAPSNTPPTLDVPPDVSIHEGESLAPIEFTVEDAESSAVNLVVTAQSSNLGLLPNENILLSGTGSLRVISLSPAENSNGATTITLTVNDGLESTSQSFTLTVEPNMAPTISEIADQTGYAGDPIGPIAFTIGDENLAANALSVSVTSSNIALVPASAIEINGSGENRTVSLYPPDSSLMDSAAIRIIVSDGSDTASSEFTVTTISGVPVITRQPSDVLELVGGITAFSVEAQGRPELSYQWHFNGQGIAGANGPTHLISEVASVHAGEYSVVVANENGSVSSVIVRLDIQTAISESQRTVVALEGDLGQQILSVQETGSNLVYQWYVGESGDKSQPIDGATASSFEPPAMDERASYWVEVKKDNGSASDVDYAYSNTFVVEGAALDRYFFGEFAGGTSGRFGLYVRSDNTAVFLGHIEHRKSIIASVNLDIEADGSFYHKSREFGWINGIVGETSVLGSVAKRDLTFSGDLSVLNGATGAIAGFYDGVITNTADGQTFVLAGPNGEVYVISGSGSDYSGYEGTVSEDGLIAVATDEAEVLSLSLNASTRKISGSTVIDGQEFSIVGKHENLDTFSELYNASIRAQVKGGDSVMIAGFVVSGPEEKRVLIRGVGPSLNGLGVPRAVDDTLLTLYRQGVESPIGLNDDWGDSENALEVALGAQQTGAFALQDGSQDSALLATLPGGVYTAHITSTTGVEGTALVEIYDMDSALGTRSDSRLVNMSLRGEIGTGDDVVIAGFVVNGDSPQQMLVRAVGPELSQYGVEGVVPDPHLTIYQNQNGEMVPIVTNEDWGSDALVVSETGANVGAFVLEEGSKSAAKVVWLVPGLYTAVARSSDGQTGVALVEVYEVR